VASWKTIGTANTDVCGVTGSISARALGDLGAVPATH